MNLILFRKDELSKDGTSVNLPPKDPRTKHILGHLKKVDGDSLIVGLIASNWKGKGILRITKDSSSDTCYAIDFGVDIRTSLETNNHPDNNNETNHDEIVLVLSLPFPKRLKLLWAQIAAFGVTRICIVRGSLSDPAYKRTSAITKEVYEPLILEGMSQGCHTRAVAVDVEAEQVLCRAVLERLNLLGDDDTNKQQGHRTARIFLDCETNLPPCRKAILESLANDDTENKSNSGDNNKTTIVLAIGSERGWTEEEANLFHQAGYKSATLGRSVLRVDTAVIAGLGIVSATLDELRQEECHKNNDRKRKQET